MLSNLPASGHDHPNFLRLRALDTDLLRQVQAMSDEELEHHSLLSINMKTGVSLDVAISLTCHPTPLCMAVCYAGTPSAAATWRKSRLKRIRNTEIIRRDPTTTAYRVLIEHDRAATRFARKHGRPLACLRINGSGDLFDESCQMINTMLSEPAAPTIWVVTRRLEQAAKLTVSPKLYLQVSLDATSTPSFVRDAEAFVRAHPRAYFSFLRASASDDTRGAAIVFNEKKTDGLPYDGGTGCPVDAGMLAYGNERGGSTGDACSRCRKCFTPSVLQRQRQLRPDLAGGAL